MECKVAARKLKMKIMKTLASSLRCAASLLACGLALSVLAQTPGNPPPRGAGGPPLGDSRRGGEPEFDGPPPFGPGESDPNRPGPGGPGGPGGMMRQETKLVDQFDQDGDKRLNSAERKAAREFLREERASGRGRRGPGRPGGPGGPRRNENHENQEPPQPGAQVGPKDVKSFPGVSLYDANTVRTLFLEFEETDWEKELADFNNTDVEVPAKLTVDGKTYPEVGVHFRGMSSFMMVGEGRKRPLNLSLDFVHEKQNLGGYRTLNLLNSHEDPTFLRSVLFCQIAREYIPAPKANFVRVVINHENWGVYVNAQQFNKDFVKEWFGTTKGARWKVPGSPQGHGSLVYLGDDAAQYNGVYQIKTKDDPKAWADLIKLCKVLNETPTNQLESALAPLLDIDGALRFLALENVLINNDGYWVRTSDYNLYQDERGRFHIIPHDTNETFSKPGGPGFGGGPGGPGGFGPAEMLASQIFSQADKNSDRRLTRDEFTALAGVWFDKLDAGKGGTLSEAAIRDRLKEAFPSANFAGQGGGRGPGGGLKVNGVELDPLIAANDPAKPLLSKLLAVPALRARYLGLIREIAEKWLDWNKLGPLAQQYHSLIALDVKADTRKLDSTEDFMKGLTEDIEGKGEGPGGGGTISLKTFAEQRRAFLFRRGEPSHP